jgi:hypothetical protein
MCFAIRVLQEDPMKKILLLSIVATAFVAGACDRYRDRDVNRERGGVYMPQERARAAETADPDNLQKQRKQQLEQQREQIIDQLYASYGGGDTARRTDSQFIPPGGEGERG